jgi:SNF2 family DNA or RNA helicase
LEDFNYLIIDEITYYKHPSSQRSKAARAVAQMNKSRQFRYRYGMTGTPNPNGLTELWHQLMLIDDGKRLGDSFYRFRQTVQTPTQTGPMANHLKWEDKPEMIDGVTQLLSDITLYHDFETVMTHVPPNHSFPVIYQLNTKMRKLYNKFEADAYALLGNGKSISAPTAGSVRQRLLQLCSGAIYNDSDDDESDYELLDDYRYELVSDLTLDRNHSVVFFNWRHQRIELCKHFKNRGIEFGMIDGSVNKKGERDGIVADFQAGNLQAIALHYKTGSHGLTLDRGEATTCSSPIYEADYAKQMLHRIYRGAQDKVTYTQEIEAEGTIEHEVYERRRAKGQNMKDFLSILQERIG